MHNVFTVKVNKVTLSANDEKRLQTIDGVKLYPYGSGTGRVSQTLTKPREKTRWRRTHNSRIPE